MSKQVIGVIIGIIVILIIVRLVVNSGMKRMLEGFSIYDRYYKQYCSSCGWRSPQTCGNCINCGLCMDANGNYECVPGDNVGPYFREDCAYWSYDSPWVNYTSPSDNRIYRVKYTDPRFVRGLQRPYSAFQPYHYYAQKRPYGNYSSTRPRRAVA